MIGDYVESTHLLCGADGPLRLVFLHQSQILSALSETITDKRVNILETVSVLVNLIFVVRFSCRHPVLISDALS